ncbi:MAG: hypothetical protein ACI8S6_000213 [Myxococcota bacterium]|jgi:hypothetical protein
MGSIVMMLMAGCMSVSGVWVMTTEFDSDAECTESIEHTFRDADPITGDDPVIVSSPELTASLGFVQILSMDDGGAIMVMGEEAYPGTKTDNGWRFTWSGETFDETNSLSDDDFFSDLTDTDERDVKIQFRIDDRASASGKVTFTSSTDRTWKESDNWGDNVRYDSQIPATAYLEDSSGRSVSNVYSEDDCDGNCELSLISTCASDATFTATRIDLSSDEAYEYLSAAGQEPGAGL